MKQISNKELRELVQRAEPTPRIPRADAFWGRFKARAECMPRETNERPPAYPRLWPKLALGAATVITLLLMLVVLEFPQLPVDNASGEPLSRVDELDVYIDHTSVMIMKDRRSGGTLVWITGTEATTDG
ncbi:MAG: hypothetical protein K9N51_13060 [Candidatus Pacebacteria bacterium]|nr:hypothetical protein [Candidatus Paceibacterota bacterium]